MHIIFNDGTGRYILSSTTGSDGTTYFSTARDGTFWCPRRDGTVHITFHCTGERNAKHTDLGTKAAVLPNVIVPLCGSFIFPTFISPTKDQGSATAAPMAKTT